LSRGEKREKEGERREDNSSIITFSRPTGHTFVVPASSVRVSATDIEKITEMDKTEMTETESIATEVGLGPNPVLGPGLRVGLAIGDVVTFSYEINARQNLPVNPEIVRIRKDIEWEDVVANYAKERRFRNGLTFIFDLGWFNTYF
jgi:hypothetical protein